MSTSKSTTVNFGTQFTNEGHRGYDFANMTADDFVDGMVLNVPRDGLNPHEFAVAQAREGNLQNAWKLVEARARTQQHAALASRETANAVQYGIEAATAWTNVKTAKVGLESAGIDLAIAETNLGIKQIQFDVVQYQAQIAEMTAPIQKAQALVQGLQVQEQFYTSAAELIRARTDRDTSLQVLNIQGYDVAPIPLPQASMAALPAFEFPSLDEVLATGSVKTVPV